MAHSNVTRSEPVSTAARMESFSGFFHMLESLPLLSGELVRQVEEGEAYEVLQRRIMVLHRNIVEFAECGKRLRDRT